MSHERVKPASLYTDPPLALIVDAIERQVYGGAVVKRAPDAAPDELPVAARPRPRAGASGRRGDGAGELLLASGAALVLRLRGQARVLRHRDRGAVRMPVRAQGPAAAPDADVAATAVGEQLVDSTFIQWTATTGGLVPPADDCEADTGGSVKEVPYTADYHFWKANR
jgi:Protein of unknown function (DUF3455)